MVAENFIKMDGLRVRWLEEGSGPAVLLLHGASLGSSADVWTGNLADLAAHGLRAIACDLPGFGGSDNPADPSLAYRTRFVPAFIEALGLKQAHLVGHSQAGRIAVSLALKRDARVSRIMALGTGSLLPPLPGAAKADAEGEDGGAAEPTLEETRKLLEESLFDRTLVTPQVLQTRQRMSTGKNFRAFLDRRQAGDVKKKQGKPGSKALWERLDEVPVPLRLVYGRQDRGNAADRAALAIARTPGLDLHLVERCKHLVQWDAAAAFAALAGAFFAAPE